MAQGLDVLMPVSLETSRVWLWPLVRVCTQRHHHSLTQRSGPIPVPQGSDLLHSGLAEGWMFA